MWISFDSSEQIIAIPSLSSCIMINENSKNPLAIMNNSITEQKNFSVASTNDHKENNIKQLPALNMQYHYRVLIYHSLQTQEMFCLLCGYSYLCQPCMKCLSSSQAAKF